MKRKKKHARGCKLDSLVCAFQKLQLLCVVCVCYISVRACDEMVMIIYIERARERINITNSMSSSCSISCSIHIQHIYIHDFKLQTFMCLCALYMRVYNIVAIFFSFSLRIYIYQYIRKFACVC